MAQQGCNSLLFPPHLLPLALRDQPVVQISIGKFLREVPSCVEPTSEQEPELKKGRPRKGAVRPRRATRGRFGGQGSRDAEQQIRLLQDNMKIPAIPRKPFVRLVQSTLEGMVGPDGAQLRMSCPALNVLQDAVEAGARVYRPFSSCCIELIYTSSLFLYTEYIYIY